MIDKNSPSWYEGVSNLLKMFQKRKCWDEEKLKDEHDETKLAQFTMMRYDLF